jgi:hypothetical protein
MGEKWMSRSDNSDRLKVMRIERRLRMAAPAGGCINATIPGLKPPTFLFETSNERPKGGKTAEM